MFDVYDSSEIGWLVVFVARNSAVSLYRVNMSLLEQLVNCWPT
jgi:hypothetical protein